MPSTKIINVQRSDSFEEVFDAFGRAEAEEVIFVFPRGSVFSREGAYFEAIKTEAERSGKTVNVMTNDPVVAHLASQQGIGVLEGPAPRPRATPEVRPLGDLKVGPQEVIAELAVARKIRKPTPVTPSGKPIQDIRTSTDDQALEVQGDEEPQVTVPLHNQPVAQPSATADIEKLWAEEESHQNIEPVTKTPSKGRMKWLWIGLTVVIVVAGVTMYATLGSAKITVYPQTKEFKETIKFTASTTTAAVDVATGRIPGQKFSAQKEVSGTYALTVKKEVAQKATGRIAIKNASSSDQRLVATTRFESKAGLIFRIPETITVPAGKTVESPVYADRPGSEYNIGPTEFTVPGLKDTPKYTQFSATSSAPMTGGMIGLSTVVSEADMVKANAELTQKVRDDVVAALKDQASGLVIGQPDEIAIDPLVVNAKAGEAAEELKVSIKATATVTAFREADVIALLNAKLEKNGGFEALSDGLQFEYAMGQAQITGTAAKKVDSDAILKAVPGMSEERITKYFSEELHLEAAVTFSPFWVSHVPTEPSDVELKIEYKKP